MANNFVKNIIERIQKDFGKLEKIGTGYSLYKISSLDILIYFRYSKITDVGRYKKAFYGLREEDIKKLQGKQSYICFITDDLDKIILFPFWKYEEYFLNVAPSNDGQYKTLPFFKSTGTELYFANIGKFNVDNYFGLSQLDKLNKRNLIVPPDLSHSKVQSLLGAIGIKKGFDIWYPTSDRINLDNSIIENSMLRNDLPLFNKEIHEIISEIDVIWLQNSNLVSLFEVEHSTPIYSGLLRFNDILLTIPSVNNFNIASNKEREKKFIKEINRPTFKQNNLIEKVTFLNYEDIYNWYFNLYEKA